MYLQDIYAKLQNHTATTARTLPSFPSCSCSFSILFMRAPSSLLLLANARIVLVWFILSRLLLTLAFSLTEGTEDGKQLAKAFLEYSKQNGGEYGI